MTFSLLKKASYRSNVLVIEFTQNMIQENEHSYNEPYNYAFKINDRLIIFPNDVVTIEPFYGDTISFSFTQDYSSYLSPGTEIYLGYATLHKIYYIQSKMGYIHPLCSTAKLGESVKELSILDGTAEVMDNNILKFIYTGDNAIRSAYKDDFYVEINNNKISPIDLIQINKTEFILKFPDYTFKLYTGKGYLKVRNSTFTKDIYGFNLKDSESLELGTYITSLNILETTDNATFLKIDFSLPLLNLATEDFAIEYNETLKSFDLISLSDDKTTAYVALYQAHATTDYINLYTKVDYSQIKTLNYLGNKVYIPNKKISTPFLVSSVKWNVFSDSLASSTLSITFNSVPDPKTIITDSTFNNGNIPWNGEVLTIPSKSLIFTKETSFDSMSIKYNQFFGELKIYSRTGYTFIASQISNSETCSLTLVDKVLSFTFNTDEKIPAYPLSIELFEYYPSPNIKNSNGKEITTTAVKGLLTYTKDNKQTTYYPPLDKESENPFVGETLTNNVVLYIDDSHDMRTYGSSDSNLVTTINGDMKIEVESNNQSPDDIKITLQNLIITQKLYIPMIYLGNIDMTNCNVNSLEVY